MADLNMIRQRSNLTTQNLSLGMLWLQGFLKKLQPLLQKLITEIFKILALQVQDLISS